MRHRYMYEVYIKDGALNVTFSLLTNQIYNFYVT